MGWGRITVAWMIFAHLSRGKGMLAWGRRDGAKYDNWQVGDQRSTYTIPQKGSLWSLNWHPLKYLSSLWKKKKGSGIHHFQPPSFFRMLLFILATFFKIISLVVHFTTCTGKLRHMWALCYEVFQPNTYFCAEPWV